MRISSATPSVTFIAMNKTPNPGWLVRFSRELAIFIFETEDEDSTVLGVEFYSLAMSKRGVPYYREASFLFYGESIPEVKRIFGVAEFGDMEPVHFTTRSFLRIYTEIQDLDEVGDMSTMFVSKLRVSEFDECYPR